ncbi:TTR-29 protein [Aphelenchoides avenae]|nr:TTR-29 protein [Aphelenchus avenae]
MYFVGFKGRLLCNGKPIKKAIRLVAQVGPIGPGDDRDWWDGLYENEAKDDDTFFRLSGWAPACKSGNLKCHDIEPFFEVFHRCNFKENRITHAYIRRFHITVPAGNVFDGMVPEKIWDMGTFDLAPYATHSKAGDVPYWDNTAHEIFGGYPYLNCSNPRGANWPSNKHFMTPTWKCGEEFP